MTAVQLAFFPFRRPLLDLFGAEFFKGIPRAAGVYTFLSEQGRVLYVGQSKDLRTRLAYYKNARPDREPRRILRMIARARAIQFELCQSVEDAQAREVDLIRQHRPTYNRALNGNPKHPFVVAGFEKGNTRLEVVESIANAPGQVFGAFRGPGQCRRLLHALGRLAWAAERPGASVYDIPLLFSDDSRVKTVLLNESNAPPALLQEYFGGTRDALAEWFGPVVDAARDPHLRIILEKDLLLLAEFFASGPETNRRIAETQCVPLPIPADALDGLRLRLRGSKRLSKLAEGEPDSETDPLRA